MQLGSPSWLKLPWRSSLIFFIRERQRPLLSHYFDDYVRISM
jgi:hypothetical protein